MPCDLLVSAAGLRARYFERAQVSASSSAIVAVGRRKPSGDLALVVSRSAPSVGF